MKPEKVDYTLLTEPPGLQLVYEDEGIAVSSPAIIRAGRRFGPDRHAWSRCSST